MKKRDTWFLSDGTTLTGSDATQHMEHLLQRYQDIIADIAATLKRCEESNQIATDDSLMNTVLYTTENLSVIRIECELLISRICEALSDDSIN